MAAKEGWRGRFFEDFEVGDVYRHPLGRTVTETDNVWFTLLTQNTAPVHFDRHYAAQTEFDRPLMNSTFTVALVTGQPLARVRITRGPPPRSTATGDPGRRRARDGAHPRVGEHTEGIPRELGYDEAGISTLKQGGVT